MALPDQPPPFGTVVFDCDSTLCALEGIDALCGERSSEVAELTRRAMSGELPLQDVYGRRLELLQPTREALGQLGLQYVRACLPNAGHLVRALSSLGKRVAIVSGGLAAPVRTLAAHLGIEAQRVHAVEVHHAPDGGFAGFDRGSPLTRAGGKLELLRQLAAEPGAGDLALVGDGATDLEAAPAVQRFVAFAGVERREAVLSAARVSCDAPDLAALAPLLLSPEELGRLSGDPEQQPLLQAAAPWLPAPQA